MGRIVRITESDLSRLVRRVIREEEDMSMTTSLFNTEKFKIETFNTAKQLYDKGKRNPSMEQQIINCITKKKLKSLFWLTTARGSYILGLIAVGLLIPGADMVEVGVLAFGYIVYVIAMERGIIESDISNDVKKLCDCLF